MDSYDSFERRGGAFCEMCHFLWRNFFIKGKGTWKYARKIYQFYIKKFHVGENVGQIGSNQGFVVWKHGNGGPSIPMLL